MIAEELQMRGEAEPMEKANYVGNKRRLAKYIVGKFPEDGKTAFDPMCFPAGTPVLTARGLRPIEEIEVGHEVFTLSGGLHRVTRKYERAYEGDLVRLRTPYHSEPLAMTPNHPVAVQNGIGVEFVRAEHLTGAERLVFPKPTFTEADLPTIRLYQPPLHPNCTPIPETVPVDEDFLTVCGLYLADGFTDGNSLCFCNLWNVKRLGRLLRSVFGLAPSYVEIESEFRGKRYPKATVRVHSRPLVEFFVSTFGRRAENKRLPDWAMLLPPDKLAVFVREFWRADGSFSERRRSGSGIFQLGTQSPALAGQLKVMFARLGALLSMQVNGGYYRLRTECQDHVARIGTAFNMDVLAERGGSSNGKLGETELGFHFKATSAERVPYAGKVFNLSVEGDPTYLTAGFAVHNCGCSAVLIEAAQRGYRVKGNDLSVVPYWYSKGVFEGRPLSEEDVEEIVGAPFHEGWLTREWEGVYPRPWQVRRYLDGLAKRAREWSGPKGWAAKAVASRVLQTLYSDSISGYSTRRYESLPKVRDVVARAAKEVNGYAADVSGKGEITNENAKGMRFPRADVVYFDPPFFKRDKGYVHYFETYRIMNSILLGRAWEEENLGPEDIPPILDKLCRGCRHIFISTSSNEAVPYARELSRHKRTMKRYRVAYTQTSGFGSRDAHQREHLYVAKANATPLDKQADPYLRLPSEEETHRYVVQEHFRGRSLHADLRFEAPGREELLGWTLAAGVPDALPNPVTTVEEAAAVASREVSRIDWETGEFRDPEGQVLAFPKEPHGPEWLEFEGVIEGPEDGQPPVPGATANFPGVLRIVDAGVIEYGVQRDGFHEYFLVSDQEDGGLHGRHLFRRLPPSDGQGERWLFARPDEQLPFVLGETAVSEGWVPPARFSALPTAVRATIPESLRYWTLEEEAARRKVRDALIEALREGGLDLGLGKSVLSDDEIEKRKIVPFNQWGGSAKYAASLSKRLPEHKRYVEPFCGSAALFFAKEPAGESVLADADSEVVFALKYIQSLTPQGFEALKRFSWTVSRAGFKRAKECEPQSDSERFWRLVYGRLCAWGGRPQMSGYSTIHDGHSYDLEELWRFHEKLKGARIARKDWKDTVRDSGGAGTLFFLDPPYVGEWGTDEGIPPEDIGQTAAKLKGDFLIAYTDSARARRAFAGVGRLFKMKFLEARNQGLWAKRNRLFVASFAIQKSDDLEFIEEVLACCP